MGIFSFFSREKKETLDKGLSKTKENVFSKITRAIAGKSKVDDEVLDNLEEVLITSDVGVNTTLKIISRIEERVARDKYVTTNELTAILREEIAALLMHVGCCGMSQIVEADMPHFLVPKKLPKARRNPIPPFWQPIGFCQHQIIIIIQFSGCSEKLFLFFLLHFMTPEIGKNGVCQWQCAFSGFYRCHFLNFRNRSW